MLVKTPESLKKEGNAFYKTEQFQKAAAKYTEAIDMLKVGGHFLSFNLNV
jgi:hypothetical protein